MATTKTEFAQKLLHDLRLRKERMAAAESQQQYSSNDSNSSSTRGSSPGPGYKGYQQTNTYEHVGLKSGDSYSKPNEDTSSNLQIVPYMNDERSSAVMELGFHKKTDPKGRVLNFLQEIGKRSLGKGRIEISSSFGKSSSSSSDSHVISFSKVHIGEISKGIQKLNQILKNCSKGITLERYSSNVGKELLKGAIDLEQSLRMLDNENARSNDLNQVERPRFSFDKANKNARKTKYIVKQKPEETQNQSMSRSVGTDLDAENEGISTVLQEKNPRTSNVIAKLMGLQDLPRKDDSIKSIPPFSKSKPTNAESMFALKANKIMSPNRAENDTNVGSVTRIRAVTVDKEEEIKNIQIDEHLGNKIIQQETGIEEKEKNVITSEAKHVSESKHENHPFFHNLQQQKKARKLNDLREKRKLHHPKQKPLIRGSKGSQQACNTSLRDTDKRQETKKLDTKTPVKQPEANRPKIVDKRQGRDSSTKDMTDEIEISKHQTEAAVDENKTEQENATKTIITGLAKQETSPLATEAKSTELSCKAAEEINYYNHSEEKDQSPVYSKPSTTNANIINIAEEAIEVTNKFQSSPQPSLCADDIETEPPKTSLPQHKGNFKNMVQKNQHIIQYFHAGNHQVAGVSIHVAENKNRLTKSENELKGILIKNRLFLKTAEALFKLNIPAAVIMLHDVDQSYNLSDNKLILDCGIELLMKKAKRRQLSYSPFKSQDCTIMFQSFDGLIQQLNKNLCTLDSYGGEWDEDYDPSENIYQMLEKDVEYRDPDINIMWDFRWNENTVASSEKDEVIKEVEKHILRKLLDELTRDLLDTQTILPCKKVKN